MNTIYIIAHIFGVVLGAGGAFASDGMFFIAVKDKVISKSEITFLKFGSAMVWVGLAIIILSGIGIFIGNPSVYLASTKFLTKMTIVGVILINGIIFHRSHIPRMVKSSGRSFLSSKEFMQKSNFLIASGVVSIVSWVAAIILGSLSSVSYSYMAMMAIYALAVIIVLLGALSMKSRFFR